MKITSVIVAFFIQQICHYIFCFKSLGLITSKERLFSLKSLNGKQKQRGDERNLEEESRVEALKSVMYQIERTYGKGSIQIMGQAPAIKVETTPSGSLTLDLALGGGYPKGRVVEIYGPESSGKTTLALHAIAGVQNAGGIAAFIDAEHALDPMYAQKLGVNIKDLVLCQPDSGEMALEIVDQLVRSSACDMVVIDSVAALVPRVELEGDMSDMQVGLQARLMSKALRKLTGSLSKSKTTVIFINQLRSKVGSFYGNPEVTAGGNALKFYSSVRLDIRRREILKDELGTRVKVKVVKNKVAVPFRTVEFDLLFGEGIDTYGCMLDAAETFGVVTRRGSWYSIGDNRFAQGKQAAVEYLRRNEELTASIDDQVRKKMDDSFHDLGILSAVSADESVPGEELPDFYEGDSEDGDSEDGDSEDGVAMGVS